MPSWSVVISWAPRWRWLRLFSSTVIALNVVTLASADADTQTDACSHHWASHREISLSHSTHFHLPGSFLGIHISSALVKHSWCLVNHWKKKHQMSVSHVQLKSIQCLVRRTAFCVKLNDLLHTYFSDNSWQVGHNWLSCQHEFGGVSGGRWRDKVKSPLHAINTHWHTATVTRHSCCCFDWNYVCVIRQRYCQVTDHLEVLTDKC